MSQIIFFSLLTVGMLVPDHIPPWQAFHNEAPVFVGLIFATIASLFSKQVVRIRWVGMGISMFFTAIALLQWRFGLLPVGGDAFLLVMYSLGFGLAWSLGFNWKANEGAARLTAMAITFAFVACVSSFIALIQSTGLDMDLAPWVTSVGDSGRAIGNIGQPNQLATLLLMGVIATWILYQQAKLGGATTILLIAVMSMGMVLSQSRTVLLSALCLPVALYLIPQRMRARFSKRPVWIWLGALLFMAISYRYVGNVVVLNTGTSGNMAREVVTTGTRPLMWTQLVAGLSQSPWWGYGFLQTATAQQHGAMLVPGIEQTNYSHNLVLDLLVWCGVPVGVFVTWVGSCWIVRRWRNAADEQTVFALLWLLPFAIHSLLEFPFAYAYFLFPVGLLIGGIDRQSSADGPSPTEQSVALQKRAFAGVVVCFLSLVTFAGWEYLRVEQDFNIARFENRRVGRTPEGYEPPNFTILSHFSVVLHAMRLRAKPGMSSEELEVLRLACQRFSWAALHMRYSTALALNGEPRKARDQMLLMRNLFGPVAYQEAKDALLSLQQQTYPELNQVILP
ncbi:Wzy polymerase domain-containing protein [Rhodoferax saidenbachensis]|uniref:Virulence factor membrane-bound polymerase C-terminal domain-containing protein n=1 Tax=Rhodoferax saidenbachensis TaxID=1484693 RepID=A0ABU1ZNU1_9BURK|nr:Wzy polymerase domain-containing protein [Rhodoferax saidenbachensis]MDR7307217.1 hypothetical protein [Rhodoferax saidenbachensis]